MQTFKTAVVVVLLLVVLYGVYEVLTRPEPTPPKEVGWIKEKDLMPPDISFGDPEGSFGEPGSSFGAPEVDSSIPGEPYVPDSIGNTPVPDSTGSWTPAPAGDGQPSSPAANVAQATSELPPPDPNVQTNPYVSANDTAANSPAASVGKKAFATAWSRSQSDVGVGKYKEALARLSVFFGSPDLTPEEHRQLVALLDPLAARVIYSREHYLNPPYVARRNDTLMEIAQQYDVPWQLLQKINGVENPQVLVPGTQLKVLEGPFRARVDLSANELTLFVGEMYAGRFTITVGADPIPQPGEYHVHDKQQNRAYYGADGRTINGGSPNNPYGRFWLDLGNGVCIHGSALEGTQNLSGCISLSPRDAENVFHILAQDAKVRVYR